MSSKDKIVKAKDQIDMIVAIGKLENINMTMHLLACDSGATMRLALENISAQIKQETEKLTAIWNKSFLDKAEG